MADNNSINISKIYLGSISDSPILDLSWTTAEADDVREGKSFYTAEGELDQGTLTTLVSSDWKVNFEPYTGTNNETDYDSITATNPAGLRIITAGYALGKNIVVIPSLEDKIINPQSVETEYFPSSGHMAFRKVIVNPPNLMGEKTISPASQDRTYYASNESGNYLGYKAVTVKAPVLQTYEAIPGKYERSYTPSEGYAGFSKFTVKAPALEEIIITPTSDKKTYTPSGDNIGFSEITVEKADVSGYIKENRSPKTAVFSLENANNFDYIPTTIPVNKVVEIVEDQEIVLIDTSTATATVDDVKKGVTFVSSGGNILTGAFEQVGGMITVEDANEMGNYLTDSNVDKIVAYIGPDSDSLGYESGALYEIVQTT